MNYVQQAIYFIGGNVSDGSKPPVYCIRIKERLDSHWAGWLGNLHMAFTPEGETLITGPVIDQTALHGLLARIRDMNLTLVAVTLVENQDEGNSEKKGSET
jgi:hypothetical protein